MPPLTQVVKGLLIINILMFVASYLIPNLTDNLALYNPVTPNFRPFQIVTHFFMHGGLFHIAFNMFALLNIGPVLESFWGKERFFLYYVLCALGAATFQCGLDFYLHQEAMQAGLYDDAKMVGASGAIFGLIVAIAFILPNAEFQIFPIPIPIKAKILVPLMIAYELFSGFKNASGDYTAHFAHIGGAITGFILLLFWGQRNQSFRQY
jgi:membrane associated rhomboid family serine protease